MKIVGAFFLAVLVIVLLTVFGLGFDRVTKPYAEETRRLTYEQSVSRGEGVETQIAGQCLSMRQATAPSDKKALASYIKSEIATFHGAISPETQTCVDEANVAFSPVTP